MGRKKNNIVELQPKDDIDMDALLADIDDDTIDMNNLLADIDDDELDVNKILADMGDYDVDMDKLLAQLDNDELDTDKNLAAAVNQCNDNDIMFDIERILAENDIDEDEIQALLTENEAATGNALALPTGRGHALPTGHPRAGGRVQPKVKSPAHGFNGR